MKRYLGILFALIFSQAAFAADNAVIVTPGTGVTMRSKDVGSGVQSMYHILGDVAGAAIYGTAGTANANTLTVQGIASMTPLFVQSATVPIVTMNSVNSNNGTNAAISGVFDDTSPTALTEDRFGFLRVSANRNLYNTIRDAAGNERGANVDASSRLTTAPSLVSGSVASGAVASGAIASGAFASGAVASGAYASGSIASGAMVDLGAIADSAATAGGTGSLSAKLRLMTTQLDTLNTNVSSSIPTGTNTIGALVANQSVNVAQINGVTPLMGNGATGTGSPRVTIASDNSPVAGMAVGATGSAVPANAHYMGAASGATGLLTGTIACDQTAIYDASTSGSTELVAISGSKVIYVCGYSIMAGGTVNVKLITGTGTACATGSSNKTPAYQLTAQAGISDGSTYFRGLKTAAGGALCINASSGVAAQAIVYFAQF